MFHANDGVAGEIVGTNKKRIVMENLGAGRLVVGVIEADESVAQEWSELASRLGELFG
jgi:hypothetical protein